MSRLRGIVPTEPTLHVAVVNLAYEPGADPRGLLRLYPTLTRFCASLAELPGLRVTGVVRCMKDADLEEGSVAWRFRSDGDDEPLPGLRTRIPRLAALVKALAPDVVHVNGFLFPAQLAELMLRTRRRPVFVVQHHAGGPDSGRRGFVQRLVTPRADGFLFTASGLAKGWRRRGMLGTKPVFEVVEGSCDFTPLESPAARATIGIEGSPAVLWVGRLHPRKDPMTALEGFRRALPQLPEATLTMAFGEAPLLPEIERFLGNAPELAGRVRLVGRIPHEALPFWYSGADLFLTSSPDEGSNYALIEAMACGLPPVASDIPPHRLLTGGGVSGELFEPGDADTCASALIRASRQTGPDRREEIRRRFEATASWPAIACQARAAYEALRARRRLASS